ncbi:hypothetical protein ABTX80_04025 [Streptomyces erythrochromogenes]|uniref:hypothetical protein n=1 Tax=Streptomyces erythrochromogenes TaxID=285574 RepID=UPI00332362F6
MNEQVSSASPNRPEAAGSCCGPAPVQPVAEAAPVESSPCCGTSEAAEAAGACCGPQAKREAAATGAGCC